MSEQKIVLILKVDASLINKHLDGRKIHLKGAAYMALREMTLDDVGMSIVVEELGEEGWMHPDEVPDCGSCDRIDPDNPPIQEI